MARLIAALLALSLASCGGCGLSYWQVDEKDDDKILLANNRPDATSMYFPATWYSPGEVIKSEPPEEIASEHCSEKGKAAAYWSKYERESRPFEGGRCTRPMTEVGTYRCMTKDDLLGPDAVELSPRAIAQAVKYFPEAAPVLAERLDASTQYQVGTWLGPYGGEAWYCSAAHHGSVGAMWTMAAAYHYGAREGSVVRSRVKDLPRAYLWYALAGKRGHSLAQELADELLASMTTEQRAEGERLLAEWQPNPAECGIGQALN